ncbi:hypothetical protein D9619_010496 [Psilocybe cf. subviscida]|uniref:Gpr1 family protein n=1 Tax=Psilocybe cf. subviscida TaxID=2480587 RepID=A0A8H5ASX3_9AGAR|nr:hypothetical protein D9619_010496 [Psilocybe cf. subviscida]
MAIFCGGIAQLLAGMWEFPRGNVFGRTAFTPYGAFWLAYATIHIPGSGILAAYEDKPELTDAIGIFLVAWTIVTIASLRKTASFIALFGFLTVTFACLAAGDLARAQGATKARGALGVITAFFAYYIGLSELLAAEDMAVAHLPFGVFLKRGD